MACEVKRYFSVFVYSQTFSCDLKNSDLDPTALGAALTARGGSVAREPVSKLFVEDWRESESTSSVSMCVTASRQRVPKL